MVLRIDDSFVKKQKRNIQKWSIHGIIFPLKFLSNQTKVGDQGSYPEKALLFTAEG